MASIIRILNLVRELIDGFRDRDGLSAYDLYVENTEDDPVMTDAEWLESLTGQPGDQGAVGEKGQKGPTGDRGQQGDQGAVGEKGLKGPTGDKGELGEQGVAGDKGPVGVDGDKGIVGEKGLKGPTGDKGEPGINGEKGQKGPTGDKGEPGDVGDKGVDGPRGEQGESVDGDGMHYEFDVARTVLSGIRDDRPQIFSDAGTYAVLFPEGSASALTGDTIVYVNTNILDATGKAKVVRASIDGKNQVIRVPKGSNDDTTRAEIEPNHRIVYRGGMPSRGYPTIFLTTSNGGDLTVMPTIDRYNVGGDDIAYPPRTRDVHISDGSNHDSNNDCPDTILRNLSYDDAAPILLGNGIRIMVNHDIHDNLVASVVDDHKSILGIEGNIEENWKYRDSASTIYLHGDDDKDIVAAITYDAVQSDKHNITVNIDEYIEVDGSVRIYSDGAVTVDGENLTFDDDHTFITDEVIRMSSGEIGYPLYQESDEPASNFVSVGDLVSIVTDANSMKVEVYQPVKHNKVSGVVIAVNEGKATVALSGHVEVDVSYIDHVPSSWTPLEIFRDSNDDIIRMAYFIRG